MKTKNRSLFRKICTCCCKKTTFRKHESEDSRPSAIDPEVVITIELSTLHQHIISALPLRNVIRHDRMEGDLLLASMEYGYVPGANPALTVLVRRPCCRSNEVEMCTPEISKQATRESFRYAFQVRLEYIGWNIYCGGGENIR